MPWKSHGRKNLVSYSPRDREEPDRTEWLHFLFSLPCIGEGNDNPPQYSCLENPRTEEPGGLPSMGSHRLGNDWRDLAAAAECSCKRIRFSDCSRSLSTSDSWPLHSSSKLISPLQNFLNYHCTVHLLAVPGSNALLMLHIASDVLWHIKNSNKKITEICILSNIISIL